MAGAVLQPGARPRLRGVLHAYAFFVSIATGGVLVALASGGRERFAALVYAGAVSLLFASSALYHRITWQREAARQWMRRLDHSAIFLLIAGTYTPFCLLAIDGTLSQVALAVVWGGAAAGIVMSMLWIGAPKPVVAAVYLAIGWVAIVTMPQLGHALGPVALSLVILGGLLYTAGAVIYARRRPDPVPTVFGYHELFHLLVVLAAAAHYTVIAVWVL